MTSLNLYTKGIKMWVPVNLPKHLFMDNPSTHLTEVLNKAQATKFILLSDINESIDGIAWID